MQPYSYFEQKSSPSIQFLTIIHYCMSIVIGVALMCFVQKLANISNYDLFYFNVLFIGAFGIPIFLFQLLINLLIMTATKSMHARWIVSVLASMCSVAFELYAFGAFDASSGVLMDEMAGGDLMACCLLLLGTVVSGSLLLLYIHLRINVKEQATLLDFPTDSN